MYNKEEWYNKEEYQSSFDSEDHGPPIVIFVLVGIVMIIGVCVGIFRSCAKSHPKTHQIVYTTTTIPVAEDGEEQEEEEERRKTVVASSRKQTPPMPKWTPPPVPVAEGCSSTTPYPPEVYDGQQPHPALPPLAGIQPVAPGWKVNAIQPKPQPSILARARVNQQISSERETQLKTISTKVELTPALVHLVPAKHKNRSVRSLSDRAKRNSSSQRDKGGRQPSRRSKRE